MKETIDVIFENGLLRPLRKLSFVEGRKIRITLDASIDNRSDEDEKSTVSAVDLTELRRRAAAVAGRFSGGGADLSLRHDEYLLEVFGEASCQAARHLNSP
jgi:predicted DNA-binding antitoxin AbrB/MazE fold protein